MAYYPSNLNLLRAFETAARHYNFSAATKELSLALATLNTQIRTLENNLGPLLFKRLPQRVVLTRIGAAYLRAPVSFSALSLAPRLALFHNEQPNIEVKVTSSLWEDEVEAESYDLDIRFRAGG